MEVSRPQAVRIAGPEPGDVRGQWHVRRHEGNANRFQQWNRLTRRDVQAALGFWGLFPQYVGSIRDECDPSIQAAAYAALFSAHKAATSAIAYQASLFGLDPGVIEQCGRVVREVYRADLTRGVVWVRGYMPV